VERTVAVSDLDLARLIRDGDGEGAARRLDAIRSEVPRPQGAVVNAAQDLRDQHQVCARQLIRRMGRPVARDTHRLDRGQEAVPGVSSALTSLIDVNGTSVRNHVLQDLHGW
jgi:hypothetical protein